MRAARADFTTLNYPGALFTFANGISGNTIVGSYSMGNRSAFGFIYNGGQYTSLMGPLASSSSATYPIPLAIDGKNIVGSWQDSAGIGHGFLYNGSNWTTLDFPGGRDTSPVGISGNTIIGTYYAGTSPSPSSFLYNGRTWTTFNVPGALSTSVNGIDGKNIVGRVQSLQCARIAAFLLTA